jgi:hypothetical protein
MTQTFETILHLESEYIKHENHGYMYSTFFTSQVKLIHHKDKYPLQQGSIKDNLWVNNLFLIRRGFKLNF